MIKQIFIGGTGRSGTTILSKIIGKHTDVFRYPYETRFIIDPDGIINLVDSLSDNWSPYIADKAIRRFVDMMNQIYPQTILRFYYRLILRQILEKINISPPQYTRYPYFRTVISRKEFDEKLNNFVSLLVDSEFSGYWTGSKPYKISPKIYSSKRFNRNEILKLSREFIDSIPRSSIWLDDTPFNILHASFLHELFPQMKLIHIYRDVRDVISSYKNQHWGGNTVEEISLWIKNILDVWNEEKEKIPKDVFYEVRFEDLIKNPRKKIEDLCDFLELEFSNEMLNVDLSKSHIGRWKSDLTKNEIEKICKILN